MLAIGTAIGWYAHRAYARIEKWGRAMNAQDAIFREVTEEDIDGALRRVKVLRFDGAVAGSLQPGTASAK